MQYGQFCPISKAGEILGEKWNILIIRELVMGGRRFNQLQRGLGDISPALLTSRLRFLQDQGLVVRKRIPGQKGYEYWPTKPCEALLPSLAAMGEWGMLWARDQVLDADLDVEFLMLYLERSVDPSHMVVAESVVRFWFTDLAQQQKYWLLVKGDRIDMCLRDPGKDVDVYITCSLRTMHDVWMGDRTYREAIDAGAMVVEGEPSLIRNIAKWLRPSSFAQSPRVPLARD